METKICKECKSELPLSAYRYDSRWGHRTDVCNECVKRKNNDTRANKKQSIVDEAQALVEESRELKLRDFTPRELMVELKRRGFKGQLRYTEVRVVDLDNL